MTGQSLPTPGSGAGMHTGTVTFLFTDIEGSTKLLERLREQYATLLEDQRIILRDCIVRWNGHEVDTQGDAFFVAFPRALDAVNCVLEAQRQLSAHAWPNNVQVKVRMGLHTGEPIVSRSGYVGMDVHRAARIAATGYGGQVLLSQTTRDLVFSDLPAGTKLRSLGAHMLKDILYPQEIYQLDIPGLPFDFPPLKSLEKLDREELPPAPGEAPYKGLQYFDEADADWFFGRQSISTRLAQAIHDQRFLAVIGASGSGKSSVVRAGMLPLLRKDPEITWLIHVITPTAHPLEALAVSLTRSVESVTATATLIDDLLADGRSLHLFAQKLFAKPGEKIVNNARLLLLVDQFEELFTLCRSETERMAFVNNLLGAVEVESGSVTVVITLRADFYERVAQYPELREWISSHQIYIGAMDEDELRVAIEEPARRGGWELSPGLTDLILHDIGAGEGRQPEPGALPLLSHALLETWKRRRGNLMSLRAYTEAGGVRGAIARSADNVFNRELDPSQQQVARSIFLRLTELGEGAQDTRRRISIHELIPPGPAGDTELIQSVLLKLANARLVTTGEDTVEVAHEALIREWPALREWLAQDRDGLRLHRHLTEVAQEWELLEREPGALYRGARLAQAVEWALANPRQLNFQEQAFLEASRQAAERDQLEREAQRQHELEAAQKLTQAERQRAEEQAHSAQRLRQRAVYLAIALALALGLAGIALFFFRQASKNANLATSRELAAAAMTTMNVDPELSALLSLQALDKAYTLEAENALHASLPALHLRQTVDLDMVVETVALSPDGKWIATGEGSGAAGAKIILVDSENGQVLKTIPTQQRMIFGLAFSSDGNQLASIDWEGDVNLWDVATGELSLEFHAHDGGASRIAFSPDDSRLVTAGADATAKVWDSTTGDLILTLSGHAPASRSASAHPGGVIEALFTSDGNRIVTGGADGSARLWDAASGEAMQVFSGHRGEIYIAVNPDDSRLVTAGADGLVKVWDISPGSSSDLPIIVINHEQAARSLAFSPDGARIAAASQDGAARIWDAATGTRQLSLVGHTGDIDDLIFSRDSKQLFTGSADKTLKFWELAPGYEVVTFPGGGPFYSPDGKILAHIDADHIRLRDAISWEITGNLPIAEQPFTFLAAFSPDGKYITTCSWGGAVSVWDAETGQKIASMTGHTSRVWKVDFSLDSQRVVSASDDQTARVWDATSGAELLVLSGHHDTVQSVDFSPDGKILATASWDRSVRIWDAASGKELNLIEAEAPMTAVDYNSDGKRLAAADNDGNAYVWDVSGREPKLLFKLAGHKATMPNILFSPDDRYLATLSFDGTVKLWRMDDGSEWLTFNIGMGMTDVSFSPDGKRLAASGFEGLVRVYGLDLDETIALARSRLTRGLKQSECQRYLHVETCP